LNRIHAFLVAATAAAFAAGAIAATHPAPASAAASTPKATKIRRIKPSGWVPQNKRIDINSASRKQLMTLPGIGNAEAERIIRGRPYLTKEHLVTKKVLSIGEFQSIRAAIIALQRPQPKARATKGKS
jgi:competence protein ComEA